jgi:ribonuclease J
MTDTLRVIPLGGLGEIGMNLMVYEYGEDAIIVDCGMMFPEAATLGVDVVIPDFTYLVENASKLRGLFLTHAHEDHYGATPFLLQRLSIPVFALPYTTAILREKLVEHELEESAHLRSIQPREIVELGSLRVEAIRVTHSTVDSVGFAIRTPVGTIIHSGDFKIDPTPLDDRQTDMERFAAYGEEGVLLLVSDSTNILFGGHCPSERAVTQPMGAVMREAPGRVIVTTFSSHLHRIQQVLSIGEQLGRPVEVMGRSMLRNVDVAERLGYLRRRRLAATVHTEDRKVVVLTGSQGEPRAALSRAAIDENRKLQLGRGDTVVFSARIIPGNERPIQRLIDNIYRRGADVIAHERPHIHASGHAYTEELKMLIDAVRPKFFIPMHGTLQFLIHHARLAAEAGMGADRTAVITNGDIAEVRRDRCRVLRKAVPHGKVFIDGEAAEVPEVVVRDRRHLADDGFVIVVVAMDSAGRLMRNIEIITRGVLHVDANQHVLEDVRSSLTALLESAPLDELLDRDLLQDKLRVAVKRYFKKKFGRRPLILPVVWEM